MNVEEHLHDYAHAAPEVQALLPPTFEGTVYTVSNNWLPVVPRQEGPCTILEIGAYHGANVCSLMHTYATHKDSRIHCVDPWHDYAGYSEYQDVQVTNYATFLRNITKLSPVDLNKLYLHRGLSEDIVPTFADEMFDIIYIDGNHETKYILEDAVLSFKKLKPGGWMIFDDMHFDAVRASVDAFFPIYKPFLANVGMRDLQCFMQKKVSP